MGQSLKNLMKTLAKVRTTLYLDPKLYQDLKIQAVLEGESMSNLVCQYAAAGLEKHNKSGHQNVQQ